MPIRQLLHVLGAKFLPRQANRFPVGERRHAAPDGADPRPRHWIAGVGAEGSGRAIRRYLQTRREFKAPDDLAVLFDERRAEAIVSGTIPDEETRRLIVAAALRVHGVARVKDRMTLAALARPV